jgi:hypothetical protein
VLEPVYDYGLVPASALAPGLAAPELLLSYCETDLMQDAGLHDHRMNEVALHQIASCARCRLVVRI